MSSTDDSHTRDETVEASAHPEGSPEWIGGYRIRRVIASGGMGTVYEAVQDKPRRSVAVKVMRHGVTSASALRRFEYEAQLLARLSHPGIAQIYEAGTHDGPQGTVPFFAMEYIPNARSLTRYADERSLDLRERLQLFARVCDAVHHGHTKGIIHRDLKPDNILVDSTGQPRIIDFGVARATDSDLAMPTLQTSVGDLVGTLQYMSPEQCEADPHDIDTRTDVYSLGVILYELLCGRLPYDVTRAPIHEAARMVRETQPGDPGSIRPGLPRDVRTLAGKAIQKSRERRYQSALALADDIRRWLRGEAIEARPPSLPYQLAVFARRHRALVGAVGAFVAALAIGLGVSTYLYLQAHRAEARAEAQREQALAALSFMESMIWSSDPLRVGDRVKVGDLLDAYSKELDQAFPDQPEIEARIRTTIGKSYLTLYLFERAVKGEAYQRSARENLAAALKLREEALGPTHPDTLESMATLVDVLTNQGRLSEAEPLARRSLELHRQVMGPDDATTVAAMDALTRVLTDQDRLAEAEPLATEALQICSTASHLPEETAFSPLESLARLRLQQGRLDEAEQSYRDLLGRISAVEGSDARPTRRARSDLAGLLLQEGKIEESRELFDKRMAADALDVKEWIQDPTPVPADMTGVLVFWEAWCPFSQVQVPEFSEVSRTFRDRGLTVITMSRAEDPDGRDRLTDFVHDKGIDLPVAIVTRDTWSYFGIPGTPGAAVIRNGDVIFAGSLDQVTDNVMARLLDRGNASAATPSVAGVPSG